MRYGLCKTERLRDFREFKKAYTEGQPYGCQFFTLFVYERPASESVRLGITATRKVGNAVKRNRCKRILRELFRHNKHLLKPGTDLVFKVKKAMVDASFRQIEAEFLRLLSSIWVGT